MTVTDRLSDGYQPNWDIDRAVGREGEEAVLWLIENWHTERVEVKRDDMAAKTGRLFFETECLSRGAWRASGIAGTKADMWVHIVGVGAMMLVVRVDELRIFLHEVKTVRAPECLLECVVSDHPTKGIVVPIVDFTRWFNTEPGKQRFLGQ